MSAPKMVTDSVYAGRRRMAERQTEAALRRADLPLSAYLHTPFADVDAVLGPMAPGEVHIPVAFSGGGKTTWLLSLVDAWVSRGEHVLMMPLEIRADMFRPMWAGFRCGVAPGDVLTGKLKRLAADGDLEAAATAKRCREMLTELGTPPWSDRLVVDESRDLDPDTLYDVIVKAGDNGFRVVVIDHMDHVADEGTNTYATTRRICKAMLDGAQDGNVIVLATSQCNNDVVRGGDALSRYQCPKPHHVLHGGAKREIATTMTGLFRPLRARRPDERPYRDGNRLVDPYRDAVQAARKDQAEPQTVLMPNVTGLCVMKHRHYGSLEGRRLYVGYDHGRNVPLTDTQRRELDAAAHAIRTAE